MKLLLDTHALLWWFQGDRQLPAHARDAIEVSETVYVSAVSGYEIAQKHRLGRLPQADPIAADLGSYVRREGFLALAITIDHARSAGALDFANRDPWDRLLIAQALAESMTLVSKEEPFDVTGVQRLW